MIPESDNETTIDVTANEHIGPHAGKAIAALTGLVIPGLGCAGIAVVCGVAIGTCIGVAVLVARWITGS